MLKLAPRRSSYYWHYYMGSKKRVFYNAPQKKIKQKRKDKYSDISSLPKIKKYRKSLEFQQKTFLFKKFKARKYFPTKATLAFYNKVVFFFKPFSRTYQSTANSNLFLTELVQKTKPSMLGVSFVLARKGSVRLYKEPALTSFLSFCFFKLKTLYKLTLEAQTLFHLGNSVQQYYLNTVGINYPYFSSMSSGRCLIANFGEEVSKSLKKSFKLNKILVDYYFNQSTFDSFFLKYTHTMLKPFNKKALIFLNQIQSNSAYYSTVLGFRKYYKTNYKTSRRIKKRIKKKITSENLKYRPYKYSS